MIKEYTGALEGGPDDKNIVSASVSKIPTREVIELWLDGKDKDVNQVITEGVYIWQAESKKFKWEMQSMEFYTRKKKEPEF